MSNLVSNGDFSTPVVTSGSTPPYSTTTITGWTKSGTGTIYIVKLNSSGFNAQPVSFSYTQHAVFQTNNNSAILTQAINFTDTGQYTLSFWASPRYDSGLFNAAQTLTVNIGVTQLVSFAPFNSNNNPWIQFVYTFTIASTGSQNLVFTVNTTTTDTSIYIAGVNITYGNTPPGYFFNSKNILNGIQGFTSNTFMASLGNGNFNTNTITNDLGIHGISYMPSTTGYSYGGVDLSQYCIAKYIDNIAITNTNIPSWCNHLRVIMSSAGGQGSVYVYNTQQDTINQRQQQQQQQSPASTHTQTQSTSATPIATGAYQSLQRDRQLSGYYDNQFNYDHVHISGTVTLLNTYNSGAGSFTFVDIQTLNLQTLQVNTNAIAINTYGILLTGGQNASGTGNGSNGQVNFQGITPTGNNYTVSNLLNGQKYSSGTQGQSGIVAYDPTATRTNGQVNQTGFFRVYYLTS